MRDRNKVADMLRKNRNNNGRPSLSPDKVKSTKLTVKMDIIEYSNLRGKAYSAGLTTSEYVRRAVVNSIIKERIKPEHLKFIRALSAMGNNLNQIAKKANQAGYYAVRFDSERLINEIDNTIKMFEDGSEDSARN